jgi:hypothetical protein
MFLCCTFCNSILENCKERVLMPGWQDYRKYSYGRINPVGSRWDRFNSTLSWYYYDSNQHDIMLLNLAFNATGCIHSNSIAFNCLYIEIHIHALSFFVLTLSDMYRIVLYSSWHAILQNCFKIGWVVQIFVLSGNFWKKWIVLSILQPSTPWSIFNLLSSGFLKTS